MRARRQTYIHRKRYGAAAAPIIYTTLNQKIRPVKRSKSNEVKGIGRLDFFSLTLESLWNQFTGEEKKNRLHATLRDTSTRYEWQQIDISSSSYCSPLFMDVTCRAIVIDYSFVCNVE